MINLIRNQFLLSVNERFQFSCREMATINITIKISWIFSIHSVYLKAWQFFIGFNSVEAMCYISQCSSVPLVGVNQQFDRANESLNYLGLIKYIVDRILHTLPLFISSVKLIWHNSDYVRLFDIWTLHQLSK